MKYSRLVIAIGLVGCLLAFPLADASASQMAQLPEEPDTSDWNNLRQLRAGDKVELVRMNLSKQKGTVLAWTEEAISLRIKGQDVTIPREDVYRVTWLSKSHRARNAWLGMAAGAAAGAVIGAVSANSVDTFLPETELLVRVFFGSLLGAGAGAGVGAAFPSHPTLYRVSHNDQEVRSKPQPPPFPGKQEERPDPQGKQSPDSREIGLQYLKEHWR